MKTLALSIIAGLAIIIAATMGHEIKKTCEDFNSAFDGASHSSGVSR